MSEEIITHIERGTGDGTSSGISISTIAGLDKTQAIENTSLFEVSIPQPGGKYVSRAIEWGNLLEKIQATTNTSNSEYAQARAEDLSTTETVYKYMDSKPSWNWGSFTEAHADQTPYVWNDIWTLCNGELIVNERVNDIETRLDGFNNSKPAFGPLMNFDTTISIVTETGEMTSSHRTETMTHAYQNPASGVNSDGFVLSFNKGNRVTNTLTCAKDGMLVLYGWVDSSGVPNVKYLPTAWCALEGNISGSWEILNLQPVIPAKQFSYVGFSIPVVEGLVVRCELGFVPGEASGRYDRTVAPTSLANVRPNAFLGGVFSIKPTET